MGSRVYNYYYKKETYLLYVKRKAILKCSVRQISRAYILLQILRTIVTWFVDAIQ